MNIAGQLLTTVIHVLAFGGIALVLWLLPGMSLTRRLVKRTRLERLFLSLISGFSMYALSVFVVRLVQLPFFVAFLPSGFLVWQYFRNPNKIRRPSRPTPAQWLFAAILALGIIFQSLPLYRSGIAIPQGFEFQEFSLHDSIWHIFLIDELKDHMPPRHPGFSGAYVHNYHYLLDLVIASIVKYLPLSTYEMYYRILPAFASAMMSLGVFVIAKKVFRSEATANIALGIALFSGNASWFVQFLRGPEFQFSSITFMLDPLINMMVNPHAVLVLPVMLGGLIFLMHKEEGVKEGGMLAALCFGVMIGFKAWGGLLVTLALAAAAVVMSVLKRDHSYWLVLGATVGIEMIIFLPVFDPQTAAGLVFIPGWTLKRMVEDPTRYNLPRYALLEQYYRADGNWLRLAQINVNEVFLYIFGNLWLRVLGVITIARMIKPLKASLIVIICMILGSLILPLLFNQGRMSYDIIQFGPYGLLLLGVFSSPFIWALASKAPSPSRLFLAFFLVLLFVPSNSQSIRDGLKVSQRVITNAELDIYRYLRLETPVDSRVLVYPSQQNTSLALVAALSHRTTYYSAETFIRITGEDYEGRRKKAVEFFNNNDPEKRRALITDSGMDYILLTKEENERTNLAGINTTQVLTNDKLTLYRIE